MAVDKKVKIFHFFYGLKWPKWYSNPKMNNVTEIEREIKKTEGALKRAQWPHKIRALKAKLEDLKNKAALAIISE